MTDVFVSYKKEDFEVANRVVVALRENGISVWWDDSLTPKSAWDKELEREIASAATVVVLWTPRSVDSDWVRTEAHYGQDHGKLVPVMMEACTISIAFMLRQTINLCDWCGTQDHRQWRKLLAWVADLAATKHDDLSIAQASCAPRSNLFRDVVDHLASGDPVVDGTLVNASTPAGTAFRDRAGLPIMRILPEGAFLLGSPATDPDRSVVEGPQKRIEIPAPFAIGVLPVLALEFEAVMGARPASEPPVPGSASWTGVFKRRPSARVPSIDQDPLVPITSVSFDDALEFTKRISSTTGEGYRLPSEAEWEYACRAGSRTRYSFGDTMEPTMANYGAIGPVTSGSFPANAFGLHDMHGNVREWTADLWHELYDLTPSDGSPATEGHGSMRVVRGGGWSDGPAMLRSAARMRATQSIRANVIGFRVARALS